MEPTLTPRNLARALGVSESTLKRWADDGRIRATRTPGGHRRITIAEAARFIRESGATSAQAEALGLAEMSLREDESLAREEPAVRLYEHLLAGHSQHARGLMLGLYLSGQSIAAIADRPIREAMRRLGELWRCSEAGVFMEHRATDICVQAVQEIRSLVDTPTQGFVAIGGAAAGDPYVLPTLLAATALAAEGIHAVNLGPDTPMAAFVEAARRHQPALVWLSVSHVEDRAALQRDLSKLASSLEPLGARLMVGGRALSKLRLPRSEGVQIGQTMAELVAFAKGLRASHPPTICPSHSDTWGTKP